MLCTNFIENGKNGQHVGDGAWYPLVDYNFLAFLENLKDFLFLKLGNPTKHLLMPEKGNVPKRQ